MQGTLARPAALAAPGLLAVTHSSDRARARCVAGDVPMIKAILVVDGDGKRIMARYYGAPEFPTGEAEATFEKKLYDKTMRTNAKNEGAPARLDALWRQRRAGLWPQGCGRAPLAALPCPSRRPRPRSARVLAAEVIMFDNIVTVYRNSADVWFYVRPRC